LAAEALHGEHEAVVELRGPAQAGHFGTHVLAHSAAAAAAEVALVPAAGAAAGARVLALGGPLGSVLPAGRRVAVLAGIRILAPFPSLPRAVAAAAVIHLPLHRSPLPPRPRAWLSSHYDATTADPSP
jgi:hypothetical protein